MPHLWPERFKKIARAAIARYFKEPRGITYAFPTMRERYPWGKHRPFVLDPRIPAKNNTEYHGLEGLAWQYHVSALYRESFHHWLIAASWRNEDAVANDFTDSGHNRAVDYCIRQARFNLALHRWQHDPSRPPPTPDRYGLSESELKSKSGIANTKLSDTIFK
jgi:hypothetical protein